jgi:hypothetical protein
MRLSSKRGTNMKRYDLALLVALVAAGCGSSKPVTVVPDPSLPTGLPTPSTPGLVNTYSAAQSPGAWIFTLDNSKDAFSYQPITYPASPNQPTTGSIQPAGGFSVLGSAGLAYEVLGRAAVLRPGNSATSPLFGVPQTECYPVTGKLRFQYIAMYPGPQTAPISQQALDPLGYGSIVASTDAAGKAWQFENLQGNVVFGPVSFIGTCNTANGQAFIGLSSSTLFSDYWATTNPSGFDGPMTITTVPSTTQSNIWIGPSGFFAADQSDPTQTPSGGASVAGMAEPASPLSTSSLAASEYLGFLYEAASYSSTGFSATAALTAPVGFGQVVPGSGTTMTGGIFPDDDVTGTPNSDIQINLGTQDAAQNGLYTSVKITALDPAQNCANFPGNVAPAGFPIPVTTGVNAQGYVTCTFPGVAVAGNPDGNYAIFVNTYNWAVDLGGVPMQIYLFQQ